MSENRQQRKLQNCSNWGHLLFGKGLCPARVSLIQWFGKFGKCIKICYFSIEEYLILQNLESRNSNPIIKTTYVALYESLQWISSSFECCRGTASSQKRKQANTLFQEFFWQASLVFLSKLYFWVNCECADRKESEGLFPFGKRIVNCSLASSTPYPCPGTSQASIAACPVCCLLETCKMLGIICLHSDRICLKQGLSQLNWFNTGHGYFWKCFAVCLETMDLEIT